MAELARKEASENLSYIDEVKVWISETLEELDKARCLSGDNTIEAWEFENASFRFMSHCDAIIRLQKSIASIYAKHKVMTLFEPVSKEIENYLKVKQEELAAFAFCVDNSNSAVLPSGEHVNTAVSISPPSEQLVKSEMLSAMSHIGGESDNPISLNEYISKLMTDRPEYDPSYIKSKIFIENTQTHLVYLKTHYGVNLLDDTHFAQRFLSHIIFYKFSYELREAFK